MTGRPSESTEYHTRLMKAALAVEDCRAYWLARRTKPQPTPEIAFQEYWFGARSLPWLQRLLGDMRARFEAYPESLAVLAAWADMSVSVRLSICHWHLQLADPLYRNFTGQFLPARASHGFESVRKSIVAEWIEECCPDRWQPVTRNQFARKLLYAATDAGLLKQAGSEWNIVAPTTDQIALTYLLYLLRGIEFEGSVTRNLYLRSVVIDEAELATRFRASSAVRVFLQGDLVDVSWQHESLTDWAEAASILQAPPKGEVA